MFRNVLRPAFAIALALCASPAFADTWSKEIGGKLRDGCAMECGAVAGEKDKPKCPVYCGCIVEEAQKLLTEAEYIEMDRDIRIPNTYVRKLPEFTAIFPICRKKGGFTQ